MSYDLFSMEDGNLLKTHGPDQCAGNPCALHNPSDHPLSHAPMKWDHSRNLMIRWCNHGYWHPDPDDITFKHRSTSAAWAAQCEIHRCDGCCQPPERRAQALYWNMVTELKPPRWYEKIWWAILALLEWVKSFFRRSHGRPKT